MGEDESDREGSVGLCQAEGAAAGTELGIEQDGGNAVRLGEKDLGPLGGDLRAGDLGGHGATGVADPDVAAAGGLLADDIHPRLASHVVHDQLSALVSRLGISKQAHLAIRLPEHQLACPISLIGPFGALQLRRDLTGGIGHPNLAAAAVP